MATTCPHCNAPNESTAQFCTSCGKALPSAAPSGPRIVSEKEFATSRTGQTLQLDEMKKQAKTAFRTLLTISILQLIGGGGLMALSFIAPSDPSIDPAALRIVAACVLVLAMVFLGLAFWSRKSPLPAAITGLVLYASLVLAGVVLNPGQVSGLFIPVIICIALGNAVRAGIKHKALRRHMAA